jgi:hypothetical protein
LDAIADRTQMDEIPLGKFSSNKTNHRIVAGSRKQEKCFA